MYQNLLALDKSLKEVLNIRESKIVTEDKYKTVERQYLLDNLNYFILSEKAKKLCNFDVVNVLYFSSESKCMGCPAQGTILTYLKNLFNERLLVFPLDTDISEPMIEILKSKYNIKELPAIVIEGKTYQGIMLREDLLKLICREFINEQKECKS